MIKLQENIENDKSIERDMANTAPMAPPAPPSVDQHAQVGAEDRTALEECAPGLLPKESCAQVR